MSRSGGSQRVHHIGLIVPSSNRTMETELPTLMRTRVEADPGDRFVFHSSRMRMQHVTPEQLVAMNQQTPRAAAELADVQPDVVATACLVAIMAQGAGYHCTAEGEITAVLREAGVPAPVVSSAGALIAGVQALGVRRVAIVTPYMRSLTDLVVKYLEHAGVEVVDALSLEVADNLAVAELDPQDLEEHWRKLDLSRAEALILSACVQMPSLPAIQRVEDASGLPVLSAATATAYRILVELGVDPVIPGSGRLLAGELPVVSAA